MSYYSKNVNNKKKKNEKINYYLNYNFLYLLVITYTLKFSILYLNNIKFKIFFGFIVLLLTNMFLHG